MLLDPWGARGQPTSPRLRLLPALCATRATGLPEPCEVHRPTAQCIVTTPPLEWSTNLCASKLQGVRRPGTIRPAWGRSQPEYRHLGAPANMPPSPPTTTSPTAKTSASPLPKPRPLNVRQSPPASPPFFLSPRHLDPSARLKSIHCANRGDRTQ